MRSRLAKTVRAFLFAGSFSLAFGLPIDPAIAAGKSVLDCKGKEASFRIAYSGSATLEDHLLKQSCAVQDLKVFDTRRGAVSKMKIMGALRDCKLIGVWDALFEADLDFLTKSSGEGTLVARDKVGVVSCRFSKVSEFDLSRTLKASLMK